MKSNLAPRIAVISLLFLNIAPSQVQDAKPAPKANRAAKSAALLPEDRQLLERLPNEFIFDPQGAKFVALSAKGELSAWLSPRSKLLA